MNTLANSMLFWLALIAALGTVYVLPSLIAAFRKTESLGWIIVLKPAANRGRLAGRARPRADPATPRITTRSRSVEPLPAGVLALMMTATDMINTLTTPAGVRSPLPSRLDSDHTSLRPALSVVLDQPAPDPELLARVRAGLLRL